MDPVTIAFIMVALSFSGGILGMMHDEQVADDNRFFNSDQAQRNREWEFSPERFNQLTELGINPDLAINAMLGNSQAANYAGSSSQPNSTNIGSILSSLFGSMGSSASDLFTANSRDEGMQLDNRLKELEAYWKPLTYQEQLDVWDEQISLWKSEGALRDAEADYMRGKVEWLPSLSQAELSQYRANTSKLFAESQLAYAKAESEGTLRDLYKSETVANYAKASESAANTVLLGSKDVTERETANYINALANLTGYQASTEYVRQRMAFFDLNLREQLNGMPLPADTYELLWIAQGVDDENVQTWAKNFEEKMYQGMRRQYDKQVSNQWDNYGKTFIMNAGNAALDMIPSFTFYKSMGRAAASSGSKGSSKGSSKGTSKVGSVSGWHQDSYGNWLPPIK